MANDNDLIRRGDALKALHYGDIAALPAVTVGVDPRIVKLNAEALAEIKATVDGQSDQPVKTIIDGLLAEIAALEPVTAPSRECNHPYCGATCGAEPVAAPVMTALSDAEIASIMAEGPKGPPMLMPDPAAIREAAAKTLLDMLYMRNGAHEGMTSEDAQKLWDAAKDRSGYAAVKAFLSALLTEKPHDR